MSDWGRNPLILRDGRCFIHCGDVVERLRDMSDCSVDTVITSPPYWGLRDYGTAVWVEGDPGCKHERVGIPANPAHYREVRHQRIPGNPTSYRERAREIGGYCAICGARRVDYQIGLESSLGAHLEVMVMVFAEIWRVLKPHGTVWLNYGDSYAAEPNGRSASATKAAGDDDRTFRDKPMSTIGPIGGYVDHGGRVVAGGVLKPKDLCMIPNRLAIALQEWGWWVRAEIIWGKTNPMPDSSGNGRPSTAHEKVFLLAKSADADVWRARDTGEISLDPDLSERVNYVSKRDPVTGELAGGAPRWIRVGYYYDASAVMQASSPNTHPRVSQDVDTQAGSHRAHGGAKGNGPMKAVTSKIAPSDSGVRYNASLSEALKTRDIEAARPLGTAPQSGLERARENWRNRRRGLTPRHEGQINHTGLDQLGRGQGRLLRNYEPAPVTVWDVATVPFKGAHFATFPPELVARCIAAGAPPENGVVLDPFGGTGTTAMVALRMGRRAHLIELNPQSVELARQRIEQDWMGEEERRLQQGRARHDALKASGALEPLPLIDEAAE